MLPSFRLIAASFLCGFVVVFAGLRLALSLHSFHGALPITAAHAAPALPAGMIDRRGALPTMATLYDLRLVTIVPTPLLTGPPTSFNERIELAPTVEPATTEPKVTVAAVDPAPAPTPKTPAIAAPISLAPPEALVPEADSDATAALPPDVVAEPEPIAAATPPEPDIPASETPPSEAPPAAEAAIPEFGANDAIALAAAATRDAKPAPRAAVKPVRKKRIHTARRAPAADQIQQPSGSWSNSNSDRWN